MDMNEQAVQSADPEQVKNVLEACLLVAGRPMSLRDLEVVFEGDSVQPNRDALRTALTSLQGEYECRGIELIEVASGWRLQSRSSMEPWVSRLFQEKTPRYSRALLETLVLVAYRQPITRGEIEEVRGVAVSSNIIKTLQEREWVKEVGHKDVPGKPALLGTTKQFLDYFNLKKLEDLPTLGELKDIDQIDAALSAELATELGIVDAATDTPAANDEGDTSAVESTIGAEPQSTDPESAEPDPDARTDTPVDQQSNPQGLVLPDARAVDLTPFRDPDGRVEPDMDLGSDDVADDDGDIATDVGPVQSQDTTQSADSEQGVHVQSEVDVTPIPETNGITPDASEDPQARLKRVIDQFAAEHRADLDAQEQANPTPKTPAQREPAPSETSADAPAATPVEWSSQHRGDARTPGVPELETESADTPPPERDDNVP